MEDAARALDRRPHGGGSVEEVHLEQPEPRVRAVQGLQVLRLALVLCENDQTELANLALSYHVSCARAIVQMNSVI